MKPKRGEVWLVQYPFTDLSAQKRRPAVVVSRDRDNQRLSNVILVPISSAMERWDADTEVFIAADSEAGRAAGLRVDSLIRCRGVMSLDAQFLARRIGRLPAAARVEVEPALRRALGMR